MPATRVPPSCGPSILGADNPSVSNFCSSLVASFSVGLFRARRSAKIRAVSLAVLLICPAMLPISLPDAPKDLPATKPANAASDIRIVALLIS